MERELLRHANRDQVGLCRFDAACGLRVLDDAAWALILDRDEPVDPGRLRTTGTLSPKAASRCSLLVPELFFDQARAHFYRQVLDLEAEAVSFLVYDFIPWLRPGALQLNDATGLMWYLWALEPARRLSFISDATRRDMFSRIRRGLGGAESVGPVFRLGADGLGQLKTSFNPAKNSYVAIGSLDGRRNQHLVLRAFEGLREQGLQCDLVICGHVFSEQNPVAREVLDKSKAYPWLRVLTHASDQDLCRELFRARALIYASSCEGFGLPPVEALWAGVPAIVAPAIPSTEGLEDFGTVVLPEVTERAIADAVVQMSNDEVAASRWAAARNAPVGTWADFSQGLWSWMAKTSKSAY